jgi:polyisoprenoid-binding protein YceI
MTDPRPYRIACLVLAGCLASLPAASRAVESWPFDPQRSHATFSVRELLIAHVRGEFAALHGSLRRTRTRTGADAGVVDASIELGDLVMHKAGDRARALGPEFFDAARHPRVRFDSDPIPWSELATGGELHGTLTLRGQSRPVAFTLLPSNCPARPLACRIRVHGALSRAAFGMHAWRGVLSDKVELNLEIELAPVH